MARHFLLYWKPETVDAHLRRNYPLVNAGSNQLESVESVDVVWIGTLAEGFELGLAGCIEVSEVASLEEASRRLGADEL